MRRGAGMFEFTVGAPEIGALDVSGRPEEEEDRGGASGPRASIRGGFSSVMGWRGCD